MVRFGHCDVVPVLFFGVPESSNVMTDGTNRPLSPNDRTDPSQFRRSVAGIVRDLLSAIVQTCPEVVEEIRQQWWNGENKPSLRHPQYLLKHAATKLREFTRDFAGYLDSVPISKSGGELTNDDHMESLRELVLLFADPIKLEDAARQIDKLNPEQWRALCEWKSLTEIRARLDELPSNRSGNEEPNQEPDELTTPVEGALHYQNRLIKTKVSAKVWLLLNHLLHAKRHTRRFDCLSDDQISDSEGNQVPVVWGNDANNDSDGWSRLYSLVRNATRFLRSQNIPYKVASDKRLLVVRLEKDQSVQRARRDTSSKARSTDANRSTRKQKRR